MFSFLPKRLLQDNIPLEMQIFVSINQYHRIKSYNTLRATVFLFSLKESKFAKHHDFQFVQKYFEIGRKVSLILNSSYAAGFASSNYIFY